MVVDCADALAALITAGMAAGSIDSGVATTDSATRAWVIRRDPSSLEDAGVFVLPSFREKEAVSRANDQITISPYVVVAKRVDPYTNAQVDAMARLCQEIEDYVERTTLVGSVASYAWIGQEPVELDDDILANDRIFWAGFQINYRVHD